MRETRKRTIKRKVFTKPDIRNLSGVFLNEYQKEFEPVAREELKPHLSVDFQVVCDDGTSYTTKEDDLWNDGNIIDIKRTVSIKMSYRSYEKDRSIDLSLSPGDYTEYNALSVSGKDRDWVNGVFNRIGEILDAVQPQNDGIREWTGYLLIPATIFCGVLFLYVLSLFMAFESLQSDISLYQAFEHYLAVSKKAVSAWLIACFLGLAATFNTREWVLKLWPSVEFDFGPLHMDITKQRRNRLAALYSYIAVPIFVMILYEVLKYAVLPKN